MAEQEQKKKPTSVKPKKTTAVSESGERRVVLSAKTDPLKFLQEEKEKLNEEILKGQETDKALKAQLTNQEPEPSEFQVTQSRKAANKEAEQAWEDAKKQMAQKSSDASFDWIRDDPVDEVEDEEEEGGILISKAKRTATSPTQRRNRNYDRIKQIIAVTLIFVAMTVSVGGFLFDKLDLIQFDTEEKPQTQEEIDIQNEAQVITDEELKGLAFTNDYPELPKGEAYKDPDVINLLLLGTDERTTRFNTNARSDSMILVSIHTRNHTVKLASFERATGVPILEGEYKGQYDWLTHCFRYGGANLILEEIQACYLLDCSHYVRTNIRAFIKLIDVVGGIDVYLTEPECNYINHWYNFRYASNHVKEMGIRDELHAVAVGKNHLNGATAMLYARCRAIDNDFGRMKRQRTVMQAIFNQIKDLSIPDLNNMLNTILPLIQTNFTRGELASLVLEVPDILDGDFETMQLPQNSTFGKMTGMEGRSLFAVDFEKNAADLRTFLYG